MVGQKKFLYDLWGDSVNIASRMESTGSPNCIQVTPAVAKRLRGSGYHLKRRGEVFVKGVGKMETYFCLGRHNSLANIKIPDYIKNDIALDDETKGKTEQ